MASDLRGGGPAREDYPPMQTDDRPYISWDELKDRLLGTPGTPERAESDRRVEAIGRRSRRLDLLFGWMNSIPPRYLYDEEFDLRRSYLGFPAMVFWRGLVESGTFYSALDALSFHFFNDEYVPKISDIGKGRRSAWRRRRREAIGVAAARWDEIKKYDDAHDGWVDAPTSS
jgi:hypothetical protein